METSLPVYPDFYIRDIPIYGRIVLAPMDGVSDFPFRSLTKRLGSAISYTEFINAIDIVNGHPDLPRRLEFAEFERPIAFQIFDDDPVRIVDAAQILMQHKPDIIDVNLGCSAKCVTNRGAGAALLREPAKIGTIISNLVGALPVPVTAKIRLGWDDQSMNYLDVARTIQDNGGSLVAVHGRTRVQAYSGLARWEPIREIKSSLSIPVIANGDIHTPQDIETVLKLTGCDAVMIGRAALENPWIFSNLFREQIPPTNVRETMLAQFESMQAYYGVGRGIILFRKYAKRLLQPYQFPHDQITSLLTTPDPASFLLQLDRLFDSVIHQSMAEKIAIIQ